MAVSSIFCLVALLYCLNTFVNVISIMENTNLINYKAGIDLGCAYNNQLNIEQCKELSRIYLEQLKEVIK